MKYGDGGTAMICLRWQVIDALVLDGDAASSVDDFEA